MPVNRGVDFEHKFKEDWLRSFPNSLCYKLPNIMSGMRTINNWADFLCFFGEKLYFIDCKAHSGASIPFDAMPQFERLNKLKNIPNLVTGFVVWLYDKDIVTFVPTYTVEKLKKDRKKSINPKTIDRELYYIVDIPSKKLRTFMQSDYSIMRNVPDYLTYISGDNK